tara:strand:- start:10429 stop:11262 length:834 start_codon:yes stop_codon:yes gene_type:complete
LQIKSNISVVIPCYNDGLFIKAAVSSLFKQTLLPDEIIIVDDGSDQATREVLNKLSDSRVRIIYQENLGVSVARNKGIEQSSSRYICTLDADDYFEPTFLKKAKKVLLQEIDVVYVSCQYRQFDYKNRTVEIICPTGGLITAFLVKNNGTSCGLFDKSDWEKVGGYDPSFKKGFEDWDFNISLLKSGKRMHIIPEVLFNYRIKERSRDQNALDLFDSQLRMQLLEKHKDLYQTHFYGVMSQYIYSNSLLRKDLRKLKTRRNDRLWQLIKMPIQWFKR